MSYCDCGKSHLHPARHLTRGAVSACIDVEMVPLVEACWDLGIETSKSCQEHTAAPLPSVFLGFARTDDYLRFGSAILAAGPRDEFYERVQGEGWEWTCHPVEFDTTSGFPHYHGLSVPVVPEWTVGVVFPHSDLGEAERRLRIGWVRIANG